MKDIKDKPDFEFEAVSYANEWELDNWGDKKGKKLVDRSFRAGLKHAETIWNDYHLPALKRIEELEKQLKSNLL